MEQRLKELFPGLVFTEDEVDWKTGDYVCGYRAHDPGATLVLDGEFTAEQLRALADWMESKIERTKP